MGLRDKYEAHHGVKITDEAVEAAVNLSDRYITDRFLPDKAIDVIDEAGSRARLSVSTIPTDVRELEAQDRAGGEGEGSRHPGPGVREGGASYRDKEKELREKLQRASSRSGRRGRTEQGSGRRRRGRSPTWSRR